MTDQTNGSTEQVDLVASNVDKLAAVYALMRGHERPTPTDLIDAREAYAATILADRLPDPKPR